MKSNDLLLLFIHNALFHQFEQRLSDNIDNKKDKYHFPINKLGSGFLNIW